jgi:hypothetical protein
MYNIEYFKMKNNEDFENIQLTNKFEILLISAYEVNYVYTA